MKFNKKLLLLLLSKQNQDAKSNLAIRLISRTEKLQTMDYKSYHTLSMEAFMSDADLLIIATLAPRADNVFTIPRPRPVPPPVTNAILPSKVPLGSIKSCLGRNSDIFDMFRELWLFFRLLANNLAKER